MKIELPSYLERGPGERRCLPWRRWLVWTGLIGLLSVLGFGLVRASAGQVQSGPAPDFTLTTFDGHTLRLSNLLGNVVVINFWASWCLPCREEAPILEAVWREYLDRGVVFIGVDYLDTEHDAFEFIAEFDITYPNGPDLRTRIAQAYRIRGVPETFFVDRAGFLRGVYIGPLTEDELRHRLETLLEDAS